jgi:sodium pump decarboxylase gamma subunit
MNEILSEGLVMMCIGMGTVLLFLCTLIIAMNVMSFCVAKLNKLFPEAVPAQAGAKPVAASNDDAIAVAIAAAVAHK